MNHEFNASDLRLTTSGFWKGEHKQNELAGMQIKIQGSFTPLTFDIRGMEPQNRILITGT
jgi:hypothetical protein